MVKLGFIVEGDTEKIILEKSDFFLYMDSLNVAYVPEVIDANGNSNLLPHNIVPHTQTLEDKGATVIFILTDLDEDECITHTKERIDPLPHQIVTVSTKAIEAWFLSDTKAMCSFLKAPDFTYQNPEGVLSSFDEIRAIRMEKNDRGIGSKPILAQLMIRSNFSIQRAAQHPNCNGAKYFLQKITEVAKAK